MLSNKTLTYSSILSPVSRQFQHKESCSYRFFFWGGAYIIIRFVFGKKNPLLWKLLLINSITCTYYLGINAIFLFSTPTEEALYLAGFDHYSSSMALIALGLAAIFMARQIDYALYEQRIDHRNLKSFKSIKTKKLYQYSAILLIFSSALLIMSELGGLLYNEKIYQDSTAAKFATVTENNMTLNDKRYLVVSTSKEKV